MKSWHLVLRDFYKVKVYKNVKLALP